MTTWLRFWEHPVIIIHTAGNMYTKRVLARNQGATSAIWY